MDNNITTYSYGNIEAMVNAIKANSELITNMLKVSKENDKEIGKRLTDYAKVKKNIGNTQIDMYRNYIEQRNSVEDCLIEYKKKESDNNIMYMLSTDVGVANNNYSVLHNFFEELNKFQVMIMEMLCGLLGQANSLLSCL